MHKEWDAEWIVRCCWVERWYAWWRNIHAACLSFAKSFCSCKSAILQCGRENLTLHLTPDSHYVSLLSGRKREINWLKIHPFCHFSCNWLKFWAMLARLSCACFWSGPFAPCNTWPATISCLQARIWSFTASVSHGKAWKHAFCILLPLWNVEGLMQLSRIYTSLSHSCLRACTRLGLWGSAWSCFSILRKSFKLVARVCNPLKYPWSVLWLLLIFVWWKAIQFQAPNFVAIMCHPKGPKGFFEKKKGVLRFIAPRPQLLSVLNILEIFQFYEVVSTCFSWPTSKLHLWAFARLQNAQHDPEQVDHGPQTITKGMTVRIPKK